MLASSCLVCAPCPQAADAARHLLTPPPQGIAVWGSRPNGEFVRLNRFQHPGSLLIDFSPGERYVMTYSSIEPKGPRDATNILLNVFDTRSGKLLRKFEGPMEEYAVGSAAGPQGSLRWPFFKWAGGIDDLYFARLGKGKVRRAVSDP